MKVSDIKCFCNGTDPSSFLQESEYSGILTSLSAFPTDLNDQKDTLNSEMDGGGLDANALNLGGFSPLFEMGYTARSNISKAKQSVDEIKEIIENDAKNHLSNEWGKYYQEVHKCTEEKKAAMDSAASYYNGLKDSDPNKDNAYSAYESAKKVYDEHVQKENEASSKYESYSGGSASEALNLDFEEMAMNAASPTTKGSGYSSDGSAAQETQASIYEELSALGYSRAGICAILANMQHESAFDLNAVGDGGTSYGLCQWHNSRWTNLNNFCAQNGLDPSTVKGQVAYLDHELKTSYPSFYQQLQNADDSPETAQSLAKTWCIDFEVPADRYNQAEVRSDSVGTYWDRSEGATTVSVISGYNSLSSMNKSNNQQTQAVKEREFDTTITNTKSDKKTDSKTTPSATASKIAERMVSTCPGTQGYCGNQVEKVVTEVTGVPTKGFATELITNGCLENAGYEKINVDPESDDYQPMPGDIVVCQQGYMPSGVWSEAGHVQVYTEDGWYSDHKQPYLYIYSNDNVVFRHSDN